MEECERGDGVAANEVAVKRRHVVQAAGRGELLGRCLWDVVPAGRGSEFERLYRLAMETGTAQPEALELYASAGWEGIEPYGYWNAVGVRL